MVDENTIALEVPLKKNTTYVAVATERLPRGEIMLLRESLALGEVGGDSLIAVNLGDGIRTLCLLDEEQGEWAFDETVRRLARPEVERLVARGDDLTVEETVELARLALATGELTVARLEEIIQNAKR